MKRRGVIISIVLVILILFGVLLYFAFRGGEEPPPESEIVNITGTEEGWRVIEHPVFSITFQVPEAWKITVFDEGKGQVQADFGAEGLTAEFNIYERANATGITADQLVQSEPTKYRRIDRDGVIGASWVEKEISESDPFDETSVGGPIANSNILVNQFFRGDKILTVRCKTLGSAYETLIPTCERMVSEVHFTNGSISSP